MRVNPKIKFVLIVLSFFIGAALFFDFIFTAYFTKTANAGSPNKIYRLAEEQHLNEIPIFGSSRAEKAYYCDDINTDCYNYGFPNQNFDVTAMLLEFELAKPKTTPVIIDMHHDFFEHDAQTNINLATYLPFIPANKNIKNFLIDNNRLAPYHCVRGSRYFGNYSNYLEPIVQNKFHIGNTNYVKGGAFDTKIDNGRSISKRIENRKAKSLQFVMLAEKDKRLRQMIAAHGERKFIIVISPYHYSAFATITNVKEMITYFHNLEKDYPNVLFFDASTLLADDKYFKDTVHLNEAGAHAFSEQLREYLINKEAF